uniref:Uncharacterized protein n=1 Tax=Glossina pallidipes TaxID=7398 RepID=A0A1A9ZSW4_GLOPL
MWPARVNLVLVVMCINLSLGYSSQQAKRSSEDDSNPLLDMASMFIQEAFSSQSNNAGRSDSSGAGLAGVASLLGSLMQANAGGQNTDAGSGAMQILSGIGTLLANAGNNNGRSSNTGGFDSSLIGNVLEMFTQPNANEGDNDGQPSAKSKRNTDGSIDFSSIIQIASAFINQDGNRNHQNRERQKRSIESNNENNIQNGNGLMELLPLIMQAINSFNGAEGQHVHEKHSGHAWVLPPFLEYIHVLWDHFSNSELGEALYERSGVNQILKFKFKNVSKIHVFFSAEEPEKHMRRGSITIKYFQTAQLMFNGFLKAQGYPKSTHFDPTRPSETISNLIDYIAKQHLSVKIDSRQYVKPAVGYSKELLKLGQARGLLQFNATDLSNKLTDTLNLEVIEPVLKVHRAYRYIAKQPHCDRYVLCQLNTPEQFTRDKKSNALISGVSSKILKVGSIGAAFFISTETETPFWTLLNVINAAADCDIKYPVDCNGFHEGEAKVTTEYAHNEFVPTLRPVPSSAEQDFICQVRSSKRTKPIASATSDDDIAFGRSCLLANIKRGTCFKRLSISISKSSLPDSAKRSRSMQSMT